MAAELEKLANELAEQGHSVGAQLVKDSSKSWLKAGLIPKKLENNVLSRQKEPQTAELSLDEEWQRQTSRYMELGYHVELNLTEEAYLTSLPKFEPQPQEYQGKFDTPLLVETRILWKKQAELSGIVISDYLLSRMNETGEWDGNSSKTPTVPYTGYFNSWGQRFTHEISPFDAREKLAKDECGASLHEGIAMQVAHPEFTQGKKYFHLIGSQVESGEVVCLDGWYGRPRLRAVWSGSAYDRFRPLVRGSKIVAG